jgi:hypothetical protein
MIELGSQATSVAWFASQRRRPDHGAFCVSKEDFRQRENGLSRQVYFDLEYSVWVSTVRQG